jgi:integrase
MSSNQSFTWPREPKSGKPARRMSYRAHLEAEGRKVPDGVANLYVRYDGKYEVGLRDASSVLKWYGPFDTVAHAKRVRDEKRVKRDRGEPEPAKRNVTFNEAADGYEAAHLPTLRTNSRVTNRSALRHLRDAFGTRRLAAIDRAALRTYIAERGHLAGWTLASHRSALSGVFRYAREDLGLPVVSPTSQVTWPERDSGGMRILNDAQLGYLLERAPDDHRLYVAVLAQTGMRKSEALGLTHADLREGAIRVERQRGRHDGRRAPLKNSRKRHAERTVTVSPALVRALRLRQLNLGAGEHEWIFADTDYNAVDRAWRKARDAAGFGSVEHDGEVIEPAVRLHDLRHSHVSSLIADGWSVDRIAARIGDSIATVLEVYAHLFDAARHADAERDELAARYDEMITVL